jgi:hypothetical protein
MGESLFGLELQASGNVFIEGVRDRQVAFRLNNGLVTLEGDETIVPGALSELEFVTPPCSSLDEARTAVLHAADLARHLAIRAKGTADGVLTFKEGESFLAGVQTGIWLTDCKLQITDPTFPAKPQGTVGVPLARLMDFIDAVLDGDGQDSADIKNDLLNMRGTGFEQSEMAGFLTACQLFILSAIRNNPQMVATRGGSPIWPKDGNSWRVFAIKSEYLKAASKGTFETDKDGNHLVLVNRDSPKSMFRLLHRTDFHSMYLALPGDQQKSLQVGPGELPAALWPRTWSKDYVIFMFPYRADPLDPGLLPPPVAYQAMGWSGDKAARPEQERWPLVEHGPTLTAWWQSVLKGRPGMAKDLASPPPGLRGRSAANIATSPFPGKDENKQEYYGMGAFGMDTKNETRLAVYEHRALDNHPNFKALEPITIDAWDAVTQFFYNTFVAPYSSGTS